MKIDVLDMTDPDLANAVMGFILPYTDQLIQIYSSSNAVMDMFRQVANAAGEAGVIDVLRIWGHGSNGSQNVATGKSGEEAIGNDSGFYSFAGDDGKAYGNIGYLTPGLQDLGRYFARNGHLELKGCGVASGAEGQIMIQQISTALRRVVHASMVVQWARAIASDGNGWTGAVMEATPDGSMPAQVQGSHL